MIKPSIITYKVLDEELNFKKVFEDESTAKNVDLNLVKTKKFLNVLKNYYQLHQEHSESNSYERTVNEEFIISSYGKFKGIVIYESSIHYDYWGGRPPITINKEKRISRNNFLNNQMQEVFNTIKGQIEACEYLSPDRGVTAMLPESIFNLAKSEINRLKEDLKILKDYINRSNN